MLTAQWACISPHDNAPIPLVMNGFEPCQRLRAQARALGRTLRIWFLTGASTAAIERRAIELGAFGVLTKPFDDTTLLARLEHGFSSPLPPVPCSAGARDGNRAGKNLPP